MTRSGWIQAGALGVLGLILWGGSARGGYSSLRCGNRLVSAGDSTYTVKNVCGEPDAKNHRIEQRTVRRVVRGPCRQGTAWGERALRLENTCSYVEEYTVDVVLDEWIYDFGRTQFVQHAMFEDNELKSVELGGYGTK